MSYSVRPSRAAAIKIYLLHLIIIDSYRTFKESMNSLSPDKKWTTKLSSAGLVYKHFGPQLISQLLGAKVTDKITGVIYDKVYEMFMEEIDAVDNGIYQTEENPR